MTAGKADCGGVESLQDPTGLTEEIGPCDWQGLVILASMGVCRMSYELGAAIISSCEQMHRGRVNHSLASANRGATVHPDWSKGGAGECQHFQLTSWERVPEEQMGTFWFLWLVFSYSGEE